MFYIVFFIIWFIFSILFLYDDFLYDSCDFLSLLSSIIIALLTTIFIFVVFKGVYWLFFHRIDLINSLIKLFIDFKEWVFDV